MCLEREPSVRSFRAGVKPLWTVWCGLGCRLCENKYVLLTTELSPQSHTQLLIWVLGIKFGSSYLCGRHFLCHLPKAPRCSLNPFPVRIFES